MPYLRVVLDTSFAGTNRTGVGLYSRRLAQQLKTIAPDHNLAFSCLGHACAEGKSNKLMGTLQEWPVYTQAVVPLLLARRHPDVIHSTSHLGPLLGAGHHIVTVHDLIFMRYPQDYNPLWLSITKALLPTVLARASAVIADSIITAQDIRRFYGTPSRKIRVIYPGVDTPSRQEAKSGRATSGVRGEPSESRYILCMGPWVGRKNLGVVVRAFERLAGEYRDLRLVMTGDLSPGMNGQCQLDIINGLPDQIRERVHLTGHLTADKLESTLRGAELLAYPSRFEGFGLPPLEAMARGVPVVASTTPAVREVSGDAALYAPPDAAAAWADVMSRVLSDRTLREELIIAGTKKSAEFTWDECARKCAEVYREVCRKPR